MKISEFREQIRGQVLIRESSKKTVSGQKIVIITGILTLSEDVKLEDETLYYMSGNSQGNLTIHTEESKKLDYDRVPSNGTIDDVMNLNRWEVPERMPQSPESEVLNNE